MKCPFSMTEHQTEECIDTIKRPHGESFNKLYNHEILTQLNEIIVKFRILQETPFFHDRTSI